MDEPEVPDRDTRPNVYHLRRPQHVNGWPNWIYPPEHHRRRRVRASRGTRITSFLLLVFNLTILFWTIALLFTWYTELTVAALLVMLVSTTVAIWIWSRNS